MVVMVEWIESQSFLNGRPVYNSFNRNTFWVLTAYYYFNIYRYIR
jgi:hypothetical protein